ncbi:DNA-directed RNA polymerase subunit delta [Psychrobacillus glaciei]|uniref:DNA-directed RNA polymerase subunit delta n=1 Tax=Psychrobacillus glaciei TaxID=2283160 RepID=A0A5J6ST51_9BACI|nr:S-adenosyl-l-methionine hydroxide adenosyltransferase family protein [Psychrobacillus glaciei]QFG00694.1 DNA-directed RNA polymerase subunit delta [Psychrobacillus glaciei]
MTEGLLVLQSDFGISDGAVSAMHGVANSVQRGLPIFDLTHQIPQYNIWEASYRLLQTINYWPEQTVFVSIVDPGVGSDRKSVVVKTEKNQYIVTPDNGTLTHVNKFIGIKEIREIDETVNRLPNSGESHTFHGRDIYAYTGARLASGFIQFEEIGPSLSLSSIIQFPLMDSKFENEGFTGIVDIIDRPFGNLWTNISRVQFKQLDADYGESFQVSISTNGRTIYENVLTYGRSFAATSIGEPLLYVNSLDNIAIAINQQSFAETYGIGTGVNWEVKILKVPQVVYN